MIEVKLLKRSEAGKRGGRDGGEFVSPEVSGFEGGQVGEGRE